MGDVTEATRTADGTADRRSMSPRRGRIADEHLASGPGQARGRPAGADRAARRGAPAHRGRARRRQDDAGQGAGRLARRTVRRIQFTPDLLPSDVTGVSIFDQERRSSSSGRARSSPTSCWPTRSTAPRPRPSPRCWRHGGAPGHRRRRELRAGPPFLVIATQNPVDMEGTYPLPEAQLDRFIARISMGYPAARRAGDARRPGHRDPLERLQPVADAAGGARPRGGRRPAARRPSHGATSSRSSRPPAAPPMRLGASPRAGLQLVRAARAAAALAGRDPVLPDDVQELAAPGAGPSPAADAGRRRSPARAPSRWSPSLQAGAPGPARALRPRVRGGPERRCPP